MIIPTKYLDLDHCVLRVAAQMVTHLAEARAMDLAELQDRVVAHMGQNAKPNVLPALDMLYLIGCIDYDDDSDVVFLQSLRGEPS